VLDGSDRQIAPNSCLDHSSDGELLRGRVGIQRSAENVANKKHIKKLLQGATIWNTWRTKEPRLQPGLSGANLSGTTLSNAILRGACSSGRSSLRAGRFILSGSVQATEDAARRAVDVAVTRTGLGREEAYMLLSVIGKLRVGTSPRPVMATRLIVPEEPLRDAGWNGEQPWRFRWLWPSPKLGRGVPWRQRRCSFARLADPLSLFESPACAVRDFGALELHANP
jgi:hypothetical protein